MHLAVMNALEDRIIKQRGIIDNQADMWNSKDAAAEAFADRCGNVLRETAMAKRECFEKCVKCGAFCAEDKSLKSPGAVLDDHLCEKHRPIMDVQEIAQTCLNTATEYFAKAPESQGRGVMHDHHWYRYCSGDSHPASLTNQHPAVSL